MADLDLDAIGTVAIVWRANGADGTADAIEALVAEVRRLRAAIEAIPRHRPCCEKEHCCVQCGTHVPEPWWPCPTERAHIAATEADRG